VYNLLSSITFLSSCLISGNNTHIGILSTLSAVVNYIFVILVAFWPFPSKKYILLHQMRAQIYRSNWSVLDRLTISLFIFSRVVPHKYKLPIPFLQFLIFCSIWKYVFFNLKRYYSFHYRKPSIKKNQKHKNDYSRNDAVFTAGKKPHPFSLLNFDISI